MSKHKFLNKDFVQLHNHTEYSPFDGMASMHNMVMKAREMGFPALAVTDHGSVGGLIKLIQKCRATVDKKGKEIPYAPIKPILGCEFYISMDHGAKDKKSQPDGRKGNYHLLIHAKNFKGYQNLCSLIHKAWTDGYYYDPRIDLDLLVKHSEGLIVTSGCPGSVVNANLMYDRYDEARQLCAFMKELFGEDFFMEIMYHGLQIEKQIIPDQLKISKDLGIPAICTNDTHYIDQAHAASHDIFLCMSMRKCMADPKRLKFPYKEFYLKSAEDMGKIFGDTPECMWNTKELADRIDIDDIAKNLFGGMRLPNFPIPRENKSPQEYLEKLAWEGLADLGWDKSPDHVVALKKELRDVNVALKSNGYDFATYFLIERDVIKQAKKDGVIVGCGRGSGFASVLLRTLGIAYGPDPLKYGLWERFLGFDDRLFIKESDFFDKEDNSLDNLINSFDQDDDNNEIIE